MPINYLALKTDIHSMGEDAKKRERELESHLDIARGLLESYAQDTIDMQRMVEEEVSRNKGLRCAVPVTEPLNTHLRCLSPLTPCTILSADGSQINPDPHDTILYGLVNIGVFRIQPGSGLVPNEITASRLLYGNDLYTQAGLATEEYIALLRDVEERRFLAELASRESGTVITLTDGQLELYHEPRKDKVFEEQFKLYLAALDDLAMGNVITAGYVSRPRADLLVTLLALLIPEGETKEVQKPFSGLTDISLLGDLLAPGERSAIFRMQSNSSKDYEGRKALHFFYLNVGTDAVPAFARVEIPLWVAENPVSIDQLHAVLLDQAHQAGNIPYPYPLIRAHEIAVVTMAERQQLTSMIETELLRQGFQPGRKSEKQSHKEHRERMRLMK